MDILITGYKGFIGKYITEMLAAQGHQLFLYDIADGFDLTDKKIIDSLPQTGFVVHLANLSFVPKSYEQPHLFYETNVMSTLNLLEYCRLNGSKMIYFSSYMYGDNLRTSVRKLTLFGHKGCMLCVHAFRRWADSLAPRTYKS